MVIIFKPYFVLALIEMIRMLTEDCIHPLNDVQGIIEPRILVGKRIEGVLLRIEIHPPELSLVILLPIIDERPAETDRVPGIAINYIRLDYKTGVCMNQTIFRVKRKGTR